MPFKLVGRRRKDARRSTPFAAPTSDTMLTEALKLAKKRSPRSSSSSSNPTSNVVRLPQATRWDLRRRQAPT